MGKIKFKYGDKVRIIKDKFFNKCIGKVINYRYVNLILIFYSIKFKHTIAEFNEQQIERIK